MKHIILLSIITVNLLSVAQNRISYTTEHNDPLLENLGVELSLFTAEFTLENEERKSDVNVNMGYGVGLTYGPILGRMQAELSWRSSYTFSGDLGASYLDGGVTWDIARKLKEKKTKVTLSESFVGNDKVETVSLEGVKVNQLNRFRARAGFFRSSTQLNLFNSAQDGVTLNVLSPYLYAKTTGVYAGLEFSTMRNLKIHVNGYKNSRYDQSYNRVFVDLMAASVNYGDVLYKSDRNTFDLNDVNRERFDSIGVTRNLGLRMGFKGSSQAYGPTIFFYEVSGGIRPPYAGLYFFLGAGMSINFHTAFMKKQAAVEPETD